MTATIKFIIAILIAMLQPNSNHQMLHTHFNYKSKQSAEALCIRITVFFRNIPNYKENVNLKLMSYMIDTVTLSAKIAAIAMIEIEHCHKRIAQLNSNKIAHAKNGNRVVMKSKSHLKYMAINKGNSNFKTNKNLMINLVNTRSPDILVISEANLEVDNNTLDIDFKGYKVESKFLGEEKLARIMVLIKSDITYERLKRYETDDNAMIVLKIKVAARRYMKAICLYRQWQILHKDEPNSGLPIKQLERLNPVMDLLRQFSSNNDELLLIGDINIDLWPPNDPSNRKDIKQIYNEYRSVMNELGICQLNFKPTRFRNHCSPSLLDHMFANHPQHVDSVETKLSVIADHCIISMQYHIKPLKIRPQFRRIRNHQLINSDIITEKIGENERLQRIFEEEDPDIIAETIIAEMNRIIEDIAPSKLVQIKGSLEPWSSSDTEEVKNKAEEQLQKAITSGDIEDWRLFRSFRNQAFRFIEAAKRTFFIGRLNNTKNLWREFRSYKGENDNSSPTKVIEGTKEITSPKKMCNVFNDFFINKTKDIQAKFDDDDEGQLEILEKLVPKPKTTLDIDHVTIDEVYAAICRMKTSNSCGFDQISSRTMKMTPEITAMWLTHLMNSMIRKQRFPRIMKISKITPIKKPRKPENLTSSYRPISNLQVYEKVIEEVLKTRITKYFEENEIILEEHHGGRRFHSTVTAMSVIEEAARRNIDNNKLGVIISTDLTAAFDTVNHRILAEKLKYYGLKGNMLGLLKSYLNQRFQYTEIQNMQSKISQSPDCSVIQGSKLSGILYTIYTNEVPRLHKLMEDKDWLMKRLKIKKPNFQEINHTVVNFVDDSNSMISFHEEADANAYIKIYFEILKFYYRISKLIINPEKTNLLMIANPTMRNRNSQLKIETESEDVIPKKQIRILGWETNSRLSMDEHLVSTIGKIKTIMSRMKEMRTYMTQKQRLMFANSFLVSRLNYGSQFLMGEKTIVRRKYHAALMSVARWVRNDYCFRESVISICKSLKWDVPSQQICKSSAKFAHSVQFSRRPIQIARQIRFPRTRSKAKLSLKIKSKNEKYDKNAITQAIKTYNKIPEDMKLLPPKKFAMALKKLWIRNDDG